MSNVIDLTEHKETIKDKPTQLIAEYITTLEWDLELLDVDPDSIANYYIKYGRLYIIHKDGSATEHDNNCEGSTDYKWADKETFYNEDFDEVWLDI